MQRQSAQSEFTEQILFQVDQNGKAYTSQNNQDRYNEVDIEVLPEIHEIIGEKTESGIAESRDGMKNGVIKSFIGRKEMSVKCPIEDHCSDQFDHDSYYDNISQ